MSRKFLTALMVVVIGGLLLAVSVQAQGPTLEAISNLNVRTGSGSSYAAIGTIPRGVMVSVEGRNQPGDWVLVHTADGTLRGWVASRYLIWGDQDVAQLPILSIEMFNPSASIAPSADITEATIPEGSMVVGTVAPTYFRQGAGTGFPTLVMLPGGMNIAAESRSADGNWVLGHSADGSWRGWVLKDHIAPNEEVGGLGVSAEVIDTPGVYQNFEARLLGYPVMPVISDRTRQIFANGQAADIQRQVFAKIGDCHTDHEAFLLPFGVGEYDLGEYTDLQDTINFFSVSPRQGVANSFVNESMAANSAFNAAAIFDPVWANPTHCLSGEAPIECEYRMIRPSLAIVQFGPVDMQIYNVEDFAFHIRKLVEISIDRGIVPVLSTFASNENLLWEKSLQFNAIILDIASEEQVPVINVWREARALPNSGLEADNFHLSYDGERSVHFTGEQSQTGIGLRNLLTLQALRELQYGLLQ